MPTRFDLTRTLVRVVPVAKIIDLRHRVLRAGFPVETANLPGDALPHTRHYALFAKSESGESMGTPLCCASFMLMPYERKTPAWQLRGMATEPSQQGRGLGAHLLQEAEAEMPAIPEYVNIKTLWCNARKGAVDFYKRNHWEVVSDEFEIETVGPHYVMVKII